ncbi:MAG: nitroreductase family protein [Clostridiales bacterium]|nr:nitroreductase family protein [Clostridiales bacterium]
MEFMDTIRARHSTRRFQEKPVERRQVERLLEAAMLAPSAKNRQNWHFVAVDGAQKAGMLAAMRRGLERESSDQALLPEYQGGYHASVRNSIRAMEEAPVTVFVLNRDRENQWEPGGRGMQYLDIAGQLSIGAAVEHLLLAAAEAGLDSLWICDIFFAYPDLSQWLAAEYQIVSAVSLGYGTNPGRQAPRVPLQERLTWKGAEEEL